MTPLKLLRLKNRLDNTEKQIHYILKRMFVSGLSVEVELGGNIVAGKVVGPRTGYGRFFDITIINSMTGKRRYFNPLYNTWRFIK